MKDECPATMQDRHEKDIQKLYDCSIPSWLRASIIAAIGVLVLGYFDFRSAVVSTYATRDEVKDMRDEWRSELRDVNRKLDELLARELGGKK